MVRKINRAGYPYQKVGIFLTRFTPAANQQTYLLEDNSRRDNMLKVAKVADRLNHLMGKDKVRLAAIGITLQGRCDRAYEKV